MASTWFGIKSNFFKKNLLSILLPTILCIMSGNYLKIFLFVNVKYLKILNKLKVIEHFLPEETHNKTVLQKKKHRVKVS